MSMDDKLEGEVQIKILHQLEGIRDCECFKIIRANKNNVPDLFFTTPKTGPWLVELKKYDKEPRIGQYKTIDKLNSCGMQACWVSGWSGWIFFVKKIGLLE
jgi:hypothetical protein